MSSEKKTTYEINADGSGFVSEMSKVASSAKHATAEISEHFEALNATVEKVSKAFAAITAIAVGGAGFEQIIKATTDWAIAQDTLARRMGLTATEAAAYQVATEKLGIDSNVLITASDKLAKNLQTNTGAFEKLHIETKNANGSWKTSGEILPDVIEKLRAIDNPMQQTIAGQKLFGKGWAEVFPLLRMTSADLEEATEKVRKLGLAMDPQEARDYKAAVSEVELVGKSLEFQIGQALLPQLKKFGNFLADEGPTIVSGFSSVLSILTKSFLTVYEAVKVVVSGIVALNVAFVQLLSGNASGAAETLKSFGQDAKDAYGEVTKLWTAVAEPPKFDPDKRKAKEGGAALDLSNPSNEKENHLAQWQAELEAAKVKYATEHDLREASKSDEIEYWQEKRNQANLTDKEVVELDRKLAETRLGMLREERAERKAAAEEQITEAERAGLGMINAQEATAKSEQALGNTTKEDLLAQEIGFEDQRLAIATKALQDRAALLRDDPDRNAVALAKIQDEILDQTRAHDLKIQEINAEAAKASETSWKHLADQITGSFASITKGLVTGTMTIYGAFSKLFQGVIDAAINMAAKMIEQWALTAIQRQIVGGVSRGAEVEGNAATAASGAFAATAAIPYVGPALAPAAAAEAYASTMAFLPAASAFGGFDIPSGMNPVTQLHAEEMVLPAKLANPLRDSLDGGGLGGGDVHLHVHAIDGKDAKRFLMGNQAHLADAIKAAHRNARF